MLKAIIFDFDGLMIDTEYTWYPIYNDYLIEHHDYHMRMDDFLTCIGSDNTHFMNIIKEEIGTDFDYEHFEKVKFDQFDSISNQLPMMAGVQELIEEAHSEGVMLALATSSQHPHALTHLKRWGIDYYFNVIITGSDVDNIKPEPDLFLKAIDELGIKAHEAVVLEDSYNGLLASNKANIDCVIVPNEVTKHSHFETHLLLIDSLEAINLSTLKELKK